MKRRKGGKIVMRYEIEELLPLVSGLAQKYGGYESTSITYEKAQTLMGAVLYCLQEHDSAHINSVARTDSSVKERYETGLKLVLEKADKIRELFNEMSFYFEDYGVKCLYDTVQRGIPEFLEWYDAQFEPQNTILTLDYPLLVDCGTLSGADAVYQYLCGIQIEQRFLRGFDKDYVVSVLKKYHNQYEDLIDNICDIMLTNAVEHIAIRKPFHETGFQEEDYLKLTEIFRQKSVDDIEKTVSHIIEEMVRRFYEDDMDMLAYFNHDARNIAVRIAAASEGNFLSLL